MSAATRRRLSIVVWVTIISGAIGTALTWLIAGDLPTHGIDYIAGAAIGGLIGACLSATETLLDGPWAVAVRRTPLWANLIARTALYGVVIVGASGVAHVVFTELGANVHPSRAMMIASVFVAVAFNLVFALRRLIGPRTFLALLVGRYHRPREERRVVLFLDLRGSTGLAERLGDEKFHRFLNHVFFDLTDSVLATSGEIYRYVGDEIIVTWPLARGSRDAACLRCLFSIIDTLARRQADYLQTFGESPYLRAAVHAGPLIVGEIGDIKREIVMIGDTMNTASRIADACRTTGQDFLASAPVLQEIGILPAGFTATSLGAVALRGKASGIELFALSASTARSA